MTYPYMKMKILKISFHGMKFSCHDSSIMKLTLRTGLLDNNIFIFHTNVNCKYYIFDKVTMQWVR